MLLLDLADLRLGGVDLGFRRGLVPLGVRQLGLQRGALVLQLPGLQGGAAQGLAQPVGLGIGAGGLEVRPQRNGRQGDG